MDFVFKHYISGETRIISLSGEEVQSMVGDFLYDIIWTCNCEPVGETNVVECNCETYLSGFKLQEFVQ